MQDEGVDMFGFPRPKHTLESMEDWAVTFLVGEGDS